MFVIGTFVTFMSKEIVSTLFIELITNFIFLLSSLVFKSFNSFSNSFKTYIFLPIKIISLRFILVSKLLLIRISFIETILPSTKVPIMLIEFSACKFH